MRGVAKAEAYNITMYIMAGLLVVGLLCNLLVRPVAARFHMKQASAAPVISGQSQTQRSAAATGSVATATPSLSVLLAWALVGLPLLWGVYETLLNAMKLFK
jgi:hypothetical protein